MYIVKVIIYILYIEWYMANYFFHQIEQVKNVFGLLIYNPT